MSPARLVDCRIEGSVATVSMDDGKRNACSPAMLRELNEALDRVQAAGSAVVLRGNEATFSAGFDLKVLRTTGLDPLRMVRAGFMLAERLLSFPTPVVLACGGYALGLGAFLLLSGDYRLGAAGAYHVCANEVAIGLTIPRAGIEICRQRLSPAHFHRATLLAERYTPEAAVEAGFLDRLVAAQDLHREAERFAAQLATLDMRAHRETKLRARRDTLRRLRAMRVSDLAGFVHQGARRVIEQRFSKGAVAGSKVLPPRVPP